MTENKSREAEYKYRKKNIKRIPFDMQISEYEKLKAVCDTNGIGINTLLKSLVADYLKKQGLT